MTKVDLLIPSYRSFKVGAYDAIQRMCSHTRELPGIDFASPLLRSCSLIHTARNRALSCARPDADYVVFVDDDMLPPVDALERLLKHEAPIVSALTTGREHFPPTLSVRKYDRERDCFYELTGYPENTLIKGDLGVGTGFMVIRGDVIKAVREDYLEANDWLADYKPILKRMGVPGKKIEHERRRRSQMRKESENPPTLFDFDWTQSGCQLGEDMSFCRRAIRLGYEVAVDTSVQVGHLGDFPYGPWNLEHKKAEEVQFDHWSD